MDLEALGPERFQQLCQSLLLREHKQVQCFPIGQADGGRDAVGFLPQRQGGTFLVYQVKFHRKPLSVPDSHKWLLAAFEDATKDEGRTTEPSPSSSVLRPSSLIEPLSQRELEVLQLIAQGLSNREISERLFLALMTVKGHNQKIFGKLQVQRRTEAVARARELGLL